MSETIQKALLAEVDLTQVVQSLVSPQKAQSLKGTELLVHRVGQSDHTTRSCGWQLYILWWASG